MDGAGLGGGHARRLPRRERTRALEAASKAARADRSIRIPFAPSTTPLPARPTRRATPFRSNSPPPKMAETLTLRGVLKGHSGWVTSIAPPLDPASDLLLTSSRCVEPPHLSLM